MRFLIVDDSAAIRAMLTNIIEEEGIGVVVGTFEDGSEVYVDQLHELEVDILLIDLLMPNRNGIDTVIEVRPHFSGKIVMISQVENKEMIGKAYSLGIDHYITKPINKLEVLNILKRISEQVLLANSIHAIEKSLGMLHQAHSKYEQKEILRPNRITDAGRSILMELGIIGENGSKDLLDILYILQEREEQNIHEIPSLKEMYEQVIKKRFGVEIEPSILIGVEIEPSKLIKEVKACEQRIRRSIHQAFQHVASLGVTDYTNPKFEYLATSFFDYNQVRMKMQELESQSANRAHHSVNIRKFILAFHFAAKQKINS